MKKVLGISGKSRNDKLAHLAPTSVVLDEREPADYLALAANIAELVNFYDLDNEAQGNWQAFLLKDKSILLAWISKTPYQSERALFNHLVLQLQALLSLDLSYQEIAKHETLICQKFNALFKLNKQVVNRINCWLTGFELDYSHYSLKDHVLQSVQGLIGNSLAEIIQLQNDLAGFFTEIEPTDEAWLRRLHATWRIDRICQLPLAHPINRAAFLDIRFLALRPRLQQLLEFYLKVIVAAAKAYSDDGYGGKPGSDKQHYPDTALLIAFSELLQPQRKMLNNLSSRHLDFYYQRVLGMGLAPAKPDYTYLLLKLKPAISEYIVASGTQFEAHPVAAKLPILYAATDSQEINQIEIAQVQTLCLDANGQLIQQTIKQPGQVKRDQNGVALSWPLFGRIRTAAGLPAGPAAQGSGHSGPMVDANANIGGQRPEPVPGSVESQTAALAKSRTGSQGLGTSEQGGGEQKSSGRQSDDQQSTDLSETGPPPQPPPGKHKIRRRSHAGQNNKGNEQGNGQGGNGAQDKDNDPLVTIKRLKLGWSFASPMFYLRSGQRTIKLTFQFLDAVNVDEFLQGQFYLSQEDHWYQVWPHADGGASGETNTLKVTIKLLPQDPAIVPFAKKMDGYKSPWPILKVLPKIHKTALDGDNVQAITISIDVADVNSPSVFYESSKLSSDNFYPFGSQCGIGSNFFVDAAEMLAKPLTAFSLTFNWNNLPASFSSYFQAYTSFLDANTNPNTAAAANMFQDSAYLVSFSYLDQGNWLPYNSESGQGGGQGAPATDQLFATSANYFGVGAAAAGVLGKGIGQAANVPPDDPSGMNTSDVLEVLQPQRSFQWSQQVLSQINPAPRALLDSQLPLTDNSYSGVIKMTLMAPEFGFGQALYSQVLNFVSLDNAQRMMLYSQQQQVQQQNQEAEQQYVSQSLSLSGLLNDAIGDPSLPPIPQQTPGVPDSGLDEIILPSSQQAFDVAPNQPYMLQAKSIQLAYRAEKHYDLNPLNNQDDYPFALHHYLPFGVRLVAASELSPITAQQGLSNFQSTQGDSQNQRGNGTDNNAADGAHPHPPRVRQRKGGQTRLAGTKLGSKTAIDQSHPTGGEQPIGQDGIHQTEGIKQTQAAAADDTAANMATGTGGSSQQSKSIQQNQSNSPNSNGAAASNAAQQLSHPDTAQPAGQAGTHPGTGNNPEPERPSSAKNQALASKQTQVVSTPDKVNKTASNAGPGLGKPLTPAATATSTAQSQQPVEAGISTLLSNVMYIALAKVSAPCQLSLFFGLTTVVAANSNDYPLVQFSYLSKHGWKAITPVQDSTDNLACSGIVVLQLPADIAINSPMMPDYQERNLAWIAISFTAQAHSLSSPVNVLLLDTQAIKVERNQQSLAANPPVIPPGAITRPHKTISALSKVLQPIASEGGIAAEQKGQYYQRVSQRIRHKGRAVTPQDYEQLALQFSPTVFFAQCFGSGDVGNKQINLALVAKVASLQQANVLTPFVPLCELEKIKHHLRQYCPDHIDLVIRNMQLRGLTINVELVLKGDLPNHMVSPDLEMLLRQYLCPWVASSKGQNPKILQEFCKTQPYALNHALSAGVLVNLLNAHSQVALVNQLHLYVRQSQAGVAQQLLEPRPGELYVPEQINLHVVASGFATGTGYVSGAAL